MPKLVLCQNNLNLVNLMYHLLEHRPGFVEENYSSDIKYLFVEILLNARRDAALYLAQEAYRRNPPGIKQMQDECGGEASNSSEECELLFFLAHVSKNAKEIRVTRDGRLRHIKEFLLSTALVGAQPTLETLRRDTNELTIMGVDGNTTFLPNMDEEVYYYVRGAYTMLFPEDNLPYEMSPPILRRLDEVKLDFVPDLSGLNFTEAAFYLLQRPGVNTFDTIMITLSSILTDLLKLHFGLEEESHIVRLIDWHKEHWLFDPWLVNSIGGTARDKEDFPCGRMAKNKKTSFQSVCSENQAQECQEYCEAVRESSELKDKLVQVYKMSSLRLDHKRFLSQLGVCQPPGVDSEVTDQNCWKEALTELGHCYSLQSSGMFKLLVLNQSTGVQ